VTQKPRHGMINCVVNASASMRMGWKRPFLFAFRIAGRAFLGNLPVFRAFQRQTARSLARRFLPKTMRIFA